MSMRREHRGVEEANSLSTKAIGMEANYKSWNFIGNQIKDVVWSLSPK